MASTVNAIVPFLRDDAGFNPEATRTMSSAFDEVCKALRILDTDAAAREIVAMRVIDVARSGEYDARELSRRVLAEGPRTSGM
jgi:hypothetical protein